MKHIAAIFCFFLVLFANAQTTDKPLVIGQIDEIESKELGEKRVLNIYLPDGYDTSKTSYPVIYLLDGSANEDFLHTVGLTQFLVMIGRMNPAIIVGIANVDRKRDFTFPTTIEKDKKDFPTTGGSAKFIAFIENELQPYINNKYKVDGTKTIIGQSLGGLLATEILIKKPQLFTTYIIVSPSLWWDNESLLKALPALAKTNTYAGIEAKIIVGKEGKVMVNDAKKLAKSVKANMAGIKTSFTYLPKEDHATILHNALYKVLALQFIYFKF
jgi:predicted alpha/beta superfamily hydrolase